MAFEILTKEDLEQVKTEIIEEIRSFFVEHKIKEARKKWIKTNDVVRILKVSPGTVQTLRLTGVIPFSKIGSVIFYDINDIEKVLEDGKVILEKYNRKLK